MNTLSEENYLKAIFRLSQKSDEKITPTAIAEALGNNAASVVDMIRKMTDKELIEYDKKKGVRLTQQGLKDSILIVRKHRLWEVFLLEKLGFHWDEIHDIAEELEHVSNASLADRLDKFLGFPEYDPHGDPIPKANGKLPKTFTVSLADVKTGASCKVAAVRDTSSSFLQYLVKLGIGIGTPIQVLERIAFDQSLVIKINEQDQTTVSQRFSESILIS
ncbi:metal-dependent transcriptional regulator [Mucilaginibacter sp. HMF5004]|uniref:metal-dependent transcriptional regulator n=1 Tax=Mucilaginibacter rivuli TaxID=2857527 RepID=UPI001C5F233F|nr:metal-dependent transcriptional regulator [Mucilaginibacter rivuli]MBW4891041.1 metal-dependent transcriptional regulator [Mucilaginibacter rivuli]